MKTIISASRRTDLPAFYSQWLLAQFQRGYAEVINPYNQKTFTVPLERDQVHSVVLWSKHFAPLLKRIDALKGYQLFFMYTINDCPELETHVPPLTERLAELDFIVHKFGVPRLLLRFDPIVHWRQGNEIGNNLASFHTILQVAARLGITSVITSFMDTSYGKLKRRGVDFIALSLEEETALAWRLGETAGALGITLKFCCNSRLFTAPHIPHTEKAHCIDGNYLMKVVGEPVRAVKDSSQRPECGCSFSRDIGSYTQTCGHGCLYCYANPLISP
jgi:hypothetical protein